MVNGVTNSAGTMHMLPIMHRPQNPSCCTQKQSCQVGKDHNTRGAPGGGDHAKLCDDHGHILSRHGVILEVEQAQARLLPPPKQCVHVKPGETDSGVQLRGAAFPAIHTARPCQAWHIVSDWINKKGRGCQCVQARPGGSMCLSHSRD